MNRHNDGPNDDQEEGASLRRQGDVLGDHHTMEDSRDPRESPLSSAEASARLSYANACTMSDASHTKSPSFEQRDGQRSAVSSIQSNAPVEEENEQAAIMPHPVRRPYEEPRGYYYQPQHQSDADGRAHHYQNQDQNQYRYPSYYPPPDPGCDSAAMSGRQYHYHPPQPSYHPQNYGYHHQDYAQISHYPSGASGQYPTQSYSYYGYQRSNPSTPHSSQPQPNTLRGAPSEVTVSTKGTPSHMAHQYTDRYGQGLDLSQPPFMEDDGRKPSVSEQQRRREIQIKGESPPQQHHDFEPIPLYEISAIPSLPSSSSTARKYPPSFQRDYHQASAQSSTPNASISRTHVAPPIPKSTPTPRPQSRILVPSSSGSNTSSAGGEGGSWEKRYAELCEFRRAHGHCEVPQNYADNNSLGTWVNKQRMEQKNRMEGKNSSLNNSRLERLQMIGFRWAKRKGQASWNEKFDELVQYKARHGNCHVPTKYKANTALGRWVSTQRAEYKKYSEGQDKTTMTAEKIARLESIGFAWFMAL